VVILEAAGIGKAFGGVAAVRDVSFGVAAGDFLAIIGPSGCGKSTLLRCLNFLEIPDSGSVRVGDVLVARMGARWSRSAEAAAHRLRAELGMVFQGFHLFPHRSVVDNLMLAPMVVKRVPQAQARAEAEALLAKVGLGAFADRMPGTLSGGQAQRAAIARALAMKPRVMLYDEPTSALDPELVDEVLQVMRDLDDEGMTQIVVTHEMRFARAAADSIIYMEAGEIVERAPPETLFGAAQDARTRRFVSRLA
jgi:polar amino acid transport system ATP-binding protein